MTMRESSRNVIEFHGDQNGERMEDEGEDEDEDEVEDEGGLDAFEYQMLSQDNDELEEEEEGQSEDGIDGEDAIVDGNGIDDGNGMGDEGAGQDVRVFGEGFVVVYDVMCSSSLFLICGSDVDGQGRRPTAHIATSTTSDFEFCRAYF